MKVGGYREGSGQFAKMGGRQYRAPHKKGGVKNSLPTINNHMGEIKLV